MTLERFETLSIEAARRLAGLGVDNVSVLHADGLAPDPELGDFDRIIINAALGGSPRCAAPPAHAGRGARLRFEREKGGREASAATID